MKVAYASKATKLKLRDAVGKFVLGALQIGTGLARSVARARRSRSAPASRSASAGSSESRRRISSCLLPVGAAAGIAAAFNAPIAAVTFTIEEIVGKLDQTVLSGVIVAAALAAVIERSVLGDASGLRRAAGIRAR